LEALIEHIGSYPDVEFTAVDNVTGEM